jgi:hypothetical protein
VPLKALFNADFEAGFEVDFELVCACLGGI